jgi:phage tail-like protein
MTDLQLNMYNFLMRSLRDADQRNGNQFVERLFTGPQAAWQTTHDIVEDIKDLWSVTDCPDEYLQYLKRIVGWTPDLDSITDGLSYDQLRRLIAVSVQLWKKRGSENTMTDLLRLLTGKRTRLFNWFDLRFILGEIELEYDNEGLDPWLLDLDGDPNNSPYYSHLQIVDDGTLDRDLVKSILNLMRAMGERIDITYVLLIDLFDAPTDSSQWQQNNGSSMSVNNGLLTLSDDTSVEDITTAVANSTAWADYVGFARIKTDILASVWFGLIYYWIDDDNYYTFSVNISSNTAKVEKIVASTPTLIQSVDLYTLDIELDISVYYMLRVQINDEGATNRIQCFIDGVQVINTTDDAHSQGSFGIYHQSSIDITCSEATVIGLPADTDLVDINQ